MKMMLSRMNLFTAGTLGWVACNGQEAGGARCLRRTNDLDQRQAPDTYGAMIAIARRGSPCPWLSLLMFATALFASGCRTATPGQLERRSGDEMVIAARFVHTGARVVLG